MFLLFPWCNLVLFLQVSVYQLVVLLSCLVSCLTIPQKFQKILVFTILSLSKTRIGLSIFFSVFLRSFRRISSLTMSKIDVVTTFVAASLLLFCATSAVSALFRRCDDSFRPFRVTVLLLLFIVSLF